MANTIEARMSALGIALPDTKPAIGNYVPFVHWNGQLLVSGQLPMEDGALGLPAPLAAMLTWHRERQRPGSARSTSLPKRKRRLATSTGLHSCSELTVSSTRCPSSPITPKSSNGASDVLVEILGDKGHHTRIAVGCSSLPMNAAVEIDAAFAID